ncbi:MAG: chemotaxis protein CheW [Bacteroidota bacterium]
MEPDDVILKERARKLSKALVSEDESSLQGLTMTGFYMAPDHYCFESHLLREVLSLKDLTFIPGVPDFIEGIINLRGQIMSVMNLRKFLDLRETGIYEQNKIIIVSHKGNEAGILVDRIDEMFRVPASEIDAAITGFGGKGAEFVKGITKNGVIVMDFETLMESNKIFVKNKRIK